MHGLHGHERNTLRPLFPWRQPPLPDSSTGPIDRHTRRRQKECPQHQFSGQFSRKRPLAAAARNGRIIPFFHCRPHQQYAGRWPHSRREETIPAGSLRRSRGDANRFRSRAGSTRNAGVTQGLPGVPAAAPTPPEAADHCRNTAARPTQMAQRCWETQRHLAQRPLLCCGEVAL